MDKIKLESLVDIRWGYNAPKNKVLDKCDIEKKDCAIYLKSGDREIINNEIFKPNYIELSRKIKPHLATNYDVLVHRLGKNPYAWAFNKYMGDIIPAHSFNVLCTYKNKDVITSEYLSYYLNNHSLKNYKVKSEDINEIIIYVPSIEEQLLVVNIYKHFIKNVKICLRFIIKWILLSFLHGEKDYLNQS